VFSIEKVKKYAFYERKYENNANYDKRVYLFVCHTIKPPINVHKKSQTKCLAFFQYKILRYAEVSTAGAFDTITIAGRTKRPFNS